MYLLIDFYLSVYMLSCAEISEGFLTVSLSLEKFSIQAAQYSIAVPLATAVLSGLYLLQGYVVLALTQGRFTTLNAALLSSPHVKNFIFGSVVIGTIAAVVFAAITAIAVAGKIGFSILLNREMTWDNWAVV